MLSDTEQQHICDHLTVMHNIEAHSVLIHFYIFRNIVAVLVFDTVVNDLAVAVIFGFKSRKELRRGVSRL